MLRFSCASTPERQSERISRIVWGGRCLKREQLRNRLGYCRLGCTALSSDRALHLGRRRFDHFNLVVCGNEEGHAAHSTDRYSGLHIGLRKDALNGNSFWLVLINEARDPIPQHGESLAEGQRCGSTEYTMRNMYRACTASIYNTPAERCRSRV
jgi:hypothetical protein